MKSTGAALARWERGDGTEVWRRRLLRAAPLLMVATLAVGPHYAAYRVTRVGWPPRTAAASAPEPVPGA